MTDCISRTSMTAGAIAVLLLVGGCERTHEDRGLMEQVVEGVDTAVAHHPGISGLNDQEAVGVIALVNNGTIETSRLADQRATSAEVRQFAQWLLAEHDRMNTRTRVTADSLDIDPVSTSPPLVAQTRESVLRNLQQMPAGPEWDRMYIAGIAELHDAALTRLREAHGGMRFMSVQDRVNEMLRLLEASLARAEALHGTNG